LKPVRSDGTTDYHEITQRPGKVDMLSRTDDRAVGCFLLAASYVDRCAATDGDELAGVAPSG
jgi:hypothetical protein